MLDAMRQAANGWAAKVLLLLLVVSFAYWGVSGQVGGIGAAEVARVGDVDVSAAEFDRALRQRIEQLSETIRQPISLEQARAFGIPDQVLNAMIADAALVDEAGQLGLGVSSDRLAALLAEDPAFRGAGGAFDRELFRQRLQGAGLTEASYLEDLRASLLRRQVESALAGGIKAPAALVEALSRHAGETRTISAVTVSATAIPPVAEPAEADLQTYFEANKARFRAPEYRKLGFVHLDPAVLADPAAVPAGEVQQAYEARRAEFTVPERRRFVQAMFPNAQEAEGAKAKIDAGATLEAVAVEAGAAATDQGLKTQAEIIDAAVASAVFAAEPDKPVLVANAPLGPAIVRVTGVEAGSTRPFAEVEAALRQQLASRSAGESIGTLYDRLEDERAGGATLPEAAGRLGLQHRTVEAVAADGAAPDGKPVEGLPGGATLITEAFRSEVGVENSPLRLGNGAFVFYDVLDTTPSRDRTLEEARPQVIAAWKADETEKRVAARADELFGKLKAGATLESVAAEIGGAVAKVEGLKRNAPPAGVSANVVAQAFAGPEGHVANAEGTTPPDRVLLRVDTVTVPPFFGESAEAQGAATQAASAIEGDLLASYGAYLVNARSPRINRAIYSQITGEARTQ